MFEQIKASVILLLGFVVIIWGVEFVNLALGNQLNAWGIRPRDVSGLIGIPLSPFLHGSIQHVMLNTLPFVVLGGLVAVQGRSVFLGVSLWIILIGGAALWAFGRASYHVGASGLIFGYFGYLVARGWYDRSISAILVTLLVLGAYGGIIWGVLPTQRYISWEGHLFGMLAGILAARFMGGRQSVAVA